MSIVEECKTLADLVAGIGSVPLERIPFPPAPGMATEADVFQRPGGEKRLYELVDGMLVEKPRGYYESLVAAILIQALRNFLDENDLGIALGADGALRLAPGLVRIPDVSFVSWDRFPGRMLPAEPIPDLAPDLAVEVLSAGNTEAEMARKVREYFAAGCRLAWLVDPKTRTARVFTGPDTFTVVAEDGELDGGEVLPGFRVSLREWFERAGSRGEASA
jgi:Uma2 family endonuclease